MLKKSQRLTTKQFNVVVKEGRARHTPLFSVRTLVGQKDTRVSAVISGKIGKTAVVRSKNRRIIYDLVREIWGSITSNSYSIVFAKKNLLEIDRSVIKEELNKLFA